MRAILLAAGFGTRLRPITERVPKCLVPIKGKPLLEIWLENLQSYGIDEFLVNTHYLSDQIDQFIKKSAYADRVTVCYEPKLLGTAATLRENIDFFQGAEGLLIHADNYCTMDFNAFVSAHQKRPSGCLLTMMTFRTDLPSSCGIVELDEQGVVIGFYEKEQNPPGNLANGAIYLLSNDFVDEYVHRFSEVADFSTEVVPKMMGRIFSYETGGLLVDIGTPEAYEKVNDCF